jgi:protein NrfD
MNHKGDVWGWMLATDFFLAGMGGGMLVFSGLAEILAGKGQVSIVAAFAAPLLIAMGAGLLLLELGRPLRGWRVFLKPRAILTIGAWSMLLAIGFGALYASFSIPGVPWENWQIVRQLLAALCVITGLVVATYPGILLGRHKARPFWTGPGMMALFLTSSLATGLAAHSLLGQISPPAGPSVLNSLHGLISGALVFQLALWLGYLYVKQTGTTLREAQAAQRWTRGDMAGQFWIGFMALGTFLPLIFEMLNSSVVWLIGDLLVISGGALMRWMVIRSGDQRTWIPGEEKYRSRLPHGDELFMKAWKDH